MIPKKAYGSRPQRFNASSQRRGNTQNEEVLVFTKTIDYQGYTIRL